MCSVWIYMVTMTKASLSPVKYTGIQAPTHSPQGCTLLLEAAHSHYSWTPSLELGSDKKISQQWILITLLG